MSTFHTLNFMYMSYFFRMRRVTLAPAVLIAGAYSMFFNLSNNLGYKVMVDRHVLRHARSMGHGAHC